MLKFTLDDFPECDIVLKSGDGVLLYVHRLILQLASTFFKDMFNLPQPDSKSTRNAIDPIDISEGAETLRQLLSLIYPCGDELCIQDMTLARQVHLLNVSSKYSIDFITSKIATVLGERAKQNPKEAFTIFAVGRIFDLPDVVRVASTACLDVAIMELKLFFPAATSADVENDPNTSLGIERASLRDVLDRFRASDYQKLLDFYWERVEAAKKRDNSPCVDEDLCLRHKDKTCDDRIDEHINAYVSREVEKRGPGSIKQFLDSQFLADQISHIDICQACWKSLSTTSGDARQDVETSFVTEELEAANALPAFGSQSRPAATARARLV